MGGVAQISATIAAHGVIRQTGTFMRLVFGERAGGLSPRGEAFLDWCRRAGFDATHSPAIQTEIWMKFINLATASAMTAASRSPVGKLRDDPDIKPVWDAAMRELIALGKASGVALPDDAFGKTVAFTRVAPPALMASMAHDLLRGGRIELPWLSGKVVALGRALNVPTLVHTVLHAILKPHADGG